MKLIALLALFGYTSATDMCCTVCGKNDTKIKTFSVDKVFNECGESCMEEKDFWKYNIFEPGLKKAESGDATPCADLGYT